MASPATIVPPGGLVLVTGVNGFLGSYIANGLLGLGYRVRGTVRSEDKAGWITQAMAERHPSGKFEAVVIPDQNATGAWEEPLKGVDGVAHVAGDMTFGPDPNKVITPLVESIRRILEAANGKGTSVKRFVYTSSNSAALNRTYGKEFVVDETWWNEDAIKEAWAPPPYEPERGFAVYSALKAQTEQELWKFQREQKPGFVLNAVLPPFCTGAILHPKQSGSTAKLVLDLWKDPVTNDFLKGFDATYVCHVEDIALLHIAALTQEDVQSKRLLGFAHAINYNSYLREFRQLDPSKSWPADDPAQHHDLSTIDGKLELGLLGRFGQNGWTSFSETVRKNCLESP